MYEQKAASTVHAHSQIHNGGMGGELFMHPNLSILTLTSTDPLSSRFHPQNGAGLSIADRPLPSQLI